jgi:PIN domain nuclease of toxin-antitoxin system
VIVLDAYALIAAARGEQAAAEVEPLLRDEECALPAANLAELYDHLLRRAGLSEQEADQHVQPLLAERVSVRPLAREQAVRAGILRARFYRPGSELSLADCALLASLADGDELATADPPLAAAARTLGFVVRALPDSQGRRPA